MKICPICGNEVDDSCLQCPFCLSKLSEKKSKSKTEKYMVLNIKQNMPSSSDANIILRKRLADLKKKGVKVVKVIHGYGSKGIGGELRYSLREYLFKLKLEGIVDFFIKGEDFKTKNKLTRKLRHLYPKINSDGDLNRNNKGISIIKLK